VSARQPDPRQRLRRARLVAAVVPAPVGSTFTVRRIPEELEFTPGLLEFLEESSLRPGCSGVVTAASPDGTLTVEIDGRHVGVGAFASERIMVTT
jgi:DtxR family transcriptional regulator, Mn-dependent transcriptional regulator